MDGSRAAQSGGNSSPSGNHFLTATMSLEETAKEKTAVSETAAQMAQRAQRWMIFGREKLAT